MKIQVRVSLLCSLLVLAFLLAAPAKAADQTDFFPFTHLTIGQERYESMVVAVGQDSQGFLWFGGQDGLNRYDGYRLKTFHLDPNDPKTISSNAVYAIYSDSHGVLWIGTQDGLNRYDAATETFHRYLFDPQDPSSLSNNTVKAIVEDASGNLWIGTNGGLNRLDRDTGKFTRFLHNPSDPSSLAHDEVYALAPGKDGNLWVGTYGGGLDALDPDTGEAVHYRSRPGDPGSLSSDLILSLYEDPQGVLWVGTWDGGLNRLDPETGVFSSYRHDPDDPASLGNDRVSAIAQDQQGKLWAGTYGGLNRLEDETGRFTRFQNDADPDSLNYNTVFGLFQDQQGLLWIGTFEGLDYYDPLRKPFRSYTSERSDPNSLSDRHVLGVLMDSSGIIWAGTPAGLNRIEGQRVTHYRHDPEDPDSLADDVVYALAEDPSGALWVGTWKGLDRLDLETGKFTHFPNNPEDPSSLSENTVYALFVDPVGVLWVGTYGGLNRFHPESGTFTRYVHDPQDADSLGANTVFAIAQDASGGLWVGTQGGGLNRLDPQTGKFQRYMNDPKEMNSIAADSVWGIYTDPAGALWLGTAAGLNRFDPRSGRFRRYGSQEGLPSGSVYGVLPDNRGSLWLSTDHGLYRFNPQSEEVIVYDRSDGLVSDDFEKEGYFRARSGELLFGTSKGLVIFDPAAIVANPYVPPVLLTGLELENSPVSPKPGSILEQSILQTEALELPYYNRILTLEFSALNFRAPQNNRYRYTLEGFDDRWYVVGSNMRRVTYTNLDPGSYVFRVTGSNDDGVWNESGTSIQVQVTPPWWETGWFRAGVIMLVTGMLLFAHQWRTNSIRQQNKRLEGAVAERTASLAETNRALEEEIRAHEQAEENLRASEARYRTIFDTTGTAMSISAPDATILLANTKYAQLSGYTKDELEGGLKWTQFLHLEDAERVVGYSRQRWNDPSAAPKNYEFRFVSRDGLVRHILASVAIIPGSDTAVASLLDITTRKELELELQRQIMRYARATQAAGAGVFEWDLHNGSYYIDPSIKALLGYQDHEIPNDLDTWSTLIHTEDQHCVKESFDAALRGETQEYLCEYRVLARDGSLHWISSNGQVLRDEDGRPLQMIGTDRDITLRKLAELQLKESEERFRTVWEAAGDALVLIDQSGFVLAANPAFFDLFGLSPDRVIEKHFKDFVSEQDLKTIVEVIQLMQGQDKALRFERQLSHHNGTPIVVEALVTHLTRNGERFPLLAMIRDITDRKRAETALQKARDQLATLLAVSQNLVSTLELDPLLNQTLDQLKQVIPYETAAVLGIEHDRIETLLYRGPELPEDLKGRGFNFANNPLLNLFPLSKGFLYIEDTYPVETLEQRFGRRLDGWAKVFALYRTWLALPLLVKGQLIGCLVLSHGQPHRFGPVARSLAQAIANQAAIAMENARLYQQAQDTAVASERMRLARDLHDSVTQALYTISLYGEAARMALSAGREEVTFENLDEIQGLAREATTDLRVLIYELRPPVLSEIGLAAALKNRLDAVEARAGMEVELEVEGDGRPPLDVETELFRVAQEALTNVLKHAHASRVKVHLRMEEDLILLAIHDNGLGFDIQDAEASDGVGLHSLRERVQRIGGRLTIETAPGSGTNLVVEIRNPFLGRRLEIRE